MKYRTPLLLLLPLLFFLFSCKTDFDVTAKYKEITIVYGLLDQNETTHFLRITKAFLGTGNALVYAKVPDSSTYGPELKVRLHYRLPNDSVRTIVFDTVMIHDKDTGTFYSPNQQMYKSNAVLNPDYDYELDLNDTLTANHVTSKTSLIKSFVIVTPKPFWDKIGFNREIQTQQKLEWKSAINGKRYQPIIKFFFKETSSANDTILREVDWVFSLSTSGGVSGGEDMAAAYLNEDFYKLCNQQIPYSDQTLEDAVRVRLADHFELSFTIVGDDFSTYLDLNGPTTGLLIEKPAYSNINNGLGVFSCHYLWKKSYLVNDLTKADLQSNGLHFFAN